jgi:glycosyltransferase involved in cell wall biosynthesis
MTTASMDGLQIAIVAPPYQRLPSDVYGGIERVVVARAAVLSEMGCVVTIIAPLSGERLGTNAIELRGIRGIPALNTQNPLLWVSRLGASTYLLPYLPTHISRRFEVVINDAYRNEPWIAYLLGKKLGFERTLNVLHGNFARNVRVRQAFSRVYSRLMFGALNTELNHQLVASGFASTLFPNGVSIPSKSETIPRPELDLVSIGRIDRAKGTDLAVELARRTGRRLTIIGPIRDQEYFDTCIAPKFDGRVEHIGEVPRYVLLDFLRKSRALVFTSRFADPHPAVLLEALSYGVPILAVSPPHPSGFYDIVEDGANGIVSDSIAQLARREAEIDELDRSKIYSGTLERWSWSAVARRYYPGIFELITSPSQGTRRS